MSTLKSKSKSLTNPSIRYDSVLIKKWSKSHIMKTPSTPYKHPGTSFEGDPGRTDQSQAAECSIDFILKRFQQTGVLPGVNVQKTYADVSEATTYHDAMNIVAHANEQFAGLDAHVRKKFSNNPAEFMEFVHDPKNAKALIKMGLATERPQSDANALLSAVQALKPPSPADSDPAPKAKKST